MKNPFIPDYETKERKMLAYYRQYAKGMITRDELYQILLDNGHLTDTLKEDFQDKLTDEYSLFIRDMLKKPKDEIMDRAYEIVCKEGIKDELLSMPIDDKERAILVDTDNVLEEFYRDWLDFDVPLTDSMRDSIEDSIASATKYYGKQDQMRPKYTLDYFKSRIKKDREEDLER